jgi:hypothetical protein
VPKPEAILQKPHGQDAPATPPFQLCGQNPFHKGLVSIQNGPFLEIFSVHRARAAQVTGERGGETDSPNP